MCFCRHAAATFSAVVFLWALWPIDSMAAVPRRRPQYTCHRLAKAPQIDGKLSDWSALPVIFLGRADQLAGGRWTGPNDCSATIRLGWDDAALYFAVEVTDDRVETGGADGAMYLRDSLQWAVDIAPSGGQGYDGDDYEYGFGRTRTGPTVFRWHVGSSGLAKGRTPLVALSIRSARGGPGLVYEARVPFEELRPLRSVAGKKIGFSIVVHDRDADGGRKQLQWTPGIVTGKNPGRFGQLIFSDAAAASGKGQIFLSGPPRMTDQPAGWCVVLPGDYGTCVLSWRLLAADGRVVDQGDVRTPTTSGNVTRFDWTLRPAPLRPGKYVMRAQVTGEKLARPLAVEHAAQRVDDSRAERLAKDVKAAMKTLSDLAARSTTAGIEAAYAEAVLAAGDVFTPFVADDLKTGQRALATRNLQALLTASRAESGVLRRQLEHGAHEWRRVPRPDMSKLAIRNGHLYAGPDPVVIAGSHGWLWGQRKMLKSGVFPRLGFNGALVCLEPKRCYGKDGRLKRDVPFWALRDCAKLARDQNLAMTTTPIAVQVWRTGPGSNAPWPAFQEAYRALLKPWIAQTRGQCPYYVISVEAQRPDGPTHSVPVPPEGGKGSARKWRRALRKTYQGPYRAWLKREYGDIADYNKACKASFSGFDRVTFPAREETNPARRYDRAAFSQQVVADQLRWCAEEIRRQDPGALVGGYPLPWQFDDPGDFDKWQCDPELDLKAFDVADVDHAGSYTSGRYAMATIRWLARYCDLFASLAPNRPLFDSEFHFVNHRRAYPIGWVPAMYFQTYVHGVSATYAWTWVRNRSIDSAILREARVCLDMAKTALDLRRLAGEIVSFHEAPADVALLFSLASMPHVPNAGEKGAPAKAPPPTHVKQTEMAYEGLFFEGVKIGFVSERQIRRGLLSKYKLLIVPAAARISDGAVEKVRQFAAGGGTVLLVGDCFSQDHRSRRHRTRISDDAVHRIPALKSPDEARAKLRPWLARLRLRPPIEVKADRPGFPAVEWCCAKDRSGRNLLFLLNMGHTPAKIRILRSGRSVGGLDLLRGEPIGPSHTVKSLEVRLVRLIEKK